MDDSLIRRRHVEAPAKTLEVTTDLIFDKAGTMGQMTMKPADQIKVVQCRSGYCRGFGRGARG